MGIFSNSDLQAIFLTLKLAAIVTLILMLIGTPIAWWLSHSRSRWRSIVNALVALPLVLPPSVLGFYLLIFMGTHGPAGKLASAIGLETLAFSFPGLVIGSTIYSLPFVVQPIHNAIASLGVRPLEAAATLRANTWDTFFKVILPLAKSGFITAAVLGFAHTVGEFGVVLMIGGNIQGETQVISVLIYEHVEAIDYERAHLLSATMLLFSFFILAFLYSTNKNVKSTSLWGTGK